MDPQQQGICHHTDLRVFLRMGHAAAANLLASQKGLKPAKVQGHDAGHIIAGGAALKVSHEKAWLPLY
jgi:hypothetical protein